MATDEYDGFYFLPSDDDDALNLAFFRFKEGENYGRPIERSGMGDKYHIAFFKCDDTGTPIFDEHFEAIFSDPTIYIKNLIGSDLYGCVLRKTEQSYKWWDKYLTKAKESCKMVAEGVK
jgi:hypothetical protein